MTKKTTRNGRSHARVNGKPATDTAVPGVKVPPTSNGAHGPAAIPLKSSVATMHKPEQKEIGPKTRIQLSLPKLKAALAVAAKKDSRAALNGVYLQAEALTLNILATDGSHLIQACMWRDKAADAWPKYLEAGVILDREALARAVAFLGKDEDVKVTERVTFEYADGATGGVLMDSSGDARIRIPIIDSPYPQYRAVIEQGSSALLGGETTPLASMSGIAREYMKAAGQVAAALEAKAVQVVPPLDDRKPWVLVYPGCEGIMHIIMPLKLDAGIGHRTLALIGTTNLKGSMAALKATITMKTRAMEETSSETAKVQHKAVIDSCKERMKAIEAAMADTSIKLTGPKSDKPAKAPKATKAPKVPKVAKPKADVAPAVPPKAVN